MFGDKSENLKVSWDCFAAVNIKRLKKMIFDPEVIETLNELSDGKFLHFTFYIFTIDILYSETAETNFHNIQLILALQHIMAPSSVILKNTKRYKASIQTSKTWLLKLVEDKALIAAQLNFAMADRQLKKLNDYPIIFGIGESNRSVSEFVLRLNNISYNFKTIIEALDATFKCYHFFQIQFSPEHKRFWALLNGLFYKIDSKLDLTPTVVSIINSFEL